MKQRIAILGSYPPPNTGITLHVKRLCALLDECQVPYVVYNATSSAGDGARVISVQRGRRTWLLKYLLCGREPVVYILSARLSAWIIGALMARLRHKRVLLRLRNDALLGWSNGGGLRKRLAAFALRRMHAVVGVNRVLCDAAVALGAAPERVHHFPGFLPPRADELDRSTVSARVWEFVAAHEPVLLANGKVNFVAGIDLYGFDQIVELTATLRGAHPRIGTVICFADHQPADEAYVDRLRAEANRRGIESHILFATEPGAMLPLLPACDVFIRPTVTDGDANSVREALACGVPTVASDVVERPDGVILFRCRDSSDLAEKVCGVLARTAERGAPCQPSLSAGDRERAAAYVRLLGDALNDPAKRPVAPGAEVTR